MEQTYKFPVYATQGGCLARRVNGTYIIVEVPEGMGLTVGDEVPEEWGTVPANQMASDESFREEYGD